MCLDVSFLRQLWTVSAILIVTIGQGMMFGYTGILLPALQESDSPIKLDLERASWLASSSAVGISSFVGFFLSSLTMDYLGRQKSFFLAIVPGVIGWTLIYFSEEFTMLLAGRFLSEITTGAVLILGAMIIGEYTAPKYRGIFLNLESAAICFGTTLIHRIGITLHWKTSAMLVLISHITALIIVSTWPESPAWLMWKNQLDKSEKAFIWLRGNSTESTREFQELIKALNKKVSSPQDQSAMSKLIKFVKKFTRKHFLQPVLIILFAFVLSETSGRHYFQAYVIEFASVITGNTIDPVYLFLSTDTIITASALFSTFLLRKLKRRTLLISTGFTALFVMISGSTYLFLVSNGVLSNNYPCIPMASFILFLILANLSCSPIPLILLGEIFPIAHRNVGSAVSGILMYISWTGTLKITPYLLESMKVHGTFAIIGLVMCVSLLTLYFMLPETKDRTLQEIEDYFKYGCFKDEVIVNDDVSDKMINKHML